MLPLVPVTVNVKVPIGVFGGFSVKIPKLEVPDPVTGVGRKDGGIEAPGNKPVTLKLTVPLKPFTAVTDMSHKNPVPLFLVTKVGVTDMVKSGVATTGAAGLGVAWPSVAGAANAST